MTKEQAIKAIKEFAGESGVYVLHHVSTRPKDRWGTYFIWFYKDASKDYQGVMKIEQRGEDFVLIEGRMMRMVE